MRTARRCARRPEAVRGRLRCATHAITKSFDGFCRAWRCHGPDFTALVRVAACHLPALLSALQTLCPHLRPLFPFSPPQPDHPNPLMLAAAAGNLATVEALLAGGADPCAADATRYTPLLFACQEVHLAVVRTLLRAGAQVTEADELGTTALALAAQVGHAAAKGTAFLMPQLF